VTDLTGRFTEALVYTTETHAQQRRTGTQTSYVSHLLGVTALVLEDGGDEDEAIAGLLHDAVEDQGGASRLDEIAMRFGQRVAMIVEGCSDADVEPKPPWRQRKEAYVRHLENASPEVVRVSLADNFITRAPSCSIIGSSATSFGGGSIPKLIRSGTTRRSPTRSARSRTVRCSANSIGSSPSSSSL
jgi:hypothetical protein